MVAACAALLWSDVAVAQAANLQGCPATKGEARALLASLKVIGEKPNGTKSYATDDVRFMGDKVLGLFADDYNDSWLHIQLPRAPAAYAPALKARYSAAAERMNCDAPNDYCYVKLKVDRYEALASFDFSNFEGRYEKEGEPDGRYLICFY